MADRVAAYKTYRPTSTLTITGDSGRSDMVKLGNGEYVTQIEDLLPGVEPDSSTAKHVERMLDYAGPSDALSATTTLSMVGYIVSIFAYGFTDSSTYAKPIPLTFLGLTLSSWIVNGVFYMPEVTEARAKAIDSYDSDLLGRLRMERKANVQDTSSQ